MSQGKLLGVLPLLAVAWALAGCTPAVTGASTRSAEVNPILSGPQIGRCHMGGCSWFDIQSFAVVRETSEGALIRLDMRQGGSEHRNSRYPESARGVAIDWQPATGDEYVFCSTRLPAYISRGEGGAWEGYRLDMIVSSGASEYVTNVYRHVCHQGEDVVSEGAAARLGYRPVTADDYVFSLSSPEAIFDYDGR